MDIRKLRDAQKADFQGNKIPAAATDGTVHWIRLSSGAVAGRLVVFDRRTGIASNYDCCPCCCPPSFTSLDVSPASTVTIPGGTQQFACTEHQVDCNGIDFPSDITLDVTWSSSNTAVATVSDSTSKGLATGVDAGTASITATFTDFTYPLSPSCFCSPHSSTTKTASATCDVQVPTFLSIVAGSSSTTSEALCNTALIECGVSRVVTYQVLDSHDNPIQIAGMQFWDSVVVTSPNYFNATSDSFITTCTGTFAGTNNGPCNKATDSLGRFDDRVAICSTLCVSDGGFCILGGPTNTNVTWHVAGVTLSSDVKQVSYYCDHILINNQ